jgi:8-oxo-dGTP pyrophosphatase MutT (NUDIX family)
VAEVEVTPIPAASVLLLRDDPLEVLMIRRPGRSSFVPNAWVFPGGAVEEGDRSFAKGVVLSARRIAGARELFEEAGIWLGAPLRDPASKRAALLRGAVGFADLFRESPIDLETLVWTSHWITPVGEPKRFDAYFFLACTDRGAIATFQESEAVDLAWIPPAQAIERHMRGEFPIVFPTLKNLEAIAGFRSAAELLDSRRNVEVPTFLPRLVIENGQEKILLP